LPLAPATLLTTAHRTSAPVLGDGELGMILSAASRPEHRLAVEGVERPWDRPSTAGDLGGISLYAVASRVAGVPPRRALFYDGCDHCLVPVLDQEVEELALGRALGFAPDDWASISAVVVLAIALPLLLAGYRNLALKAGLLAGGTAAAKIRAVAGHVGLRAQLVDSWDGAVLARELDLHPELEPIAAIVALSA
jgi:hypothetical protein